MRLLLDTCIFLWCVKNDAKLSKATRSKILAAEEVYVSSASIWEAAIKIKLKKLDVDLTELVASISKSDFIQLPITFAHAEATHKLADIHRDPFDRMLIAQSISEPLILLTADKVLTSYSDFVHLAD